MCVYRWLSLDIENYTTVVEFLMNLWMSDFFYGSNVSSNNCELFV